MPLRAQTEVENAVDGDCSGSTSGPTDSARKFRLPYHLVEPTVIAVDMFILIAASLLAGIGYSWVFSGYVPTVQSYAAIGLLAFVNLSTALAARGGLPGDQFDQFSPASARSDRNLDRRVLYVDRSRVFAEGHGALLARCHIDVFVLGLGGIIAWRRLLAHLLGYALSTGTFATRNVILIGERNRLAASPALSEMRRCGYTPIQTFEIAQEELLTSRSFHGGFGQ